ncbi:ATP-binding cassette domain-containing protein [Aquihabitans daechungensis]|uniref:ATP-binding cassette domain-containing protein n=1 Tax=Aquihabitans daechungensis TaxID=1052257 RepID=UPI003BA388C3
MILLDATDLAASRPGRQLFSDVSITLSTGDRLGLVGINGTGKSTLLRVLAGKAEPEDGTLRPGRGARVVMLDQADDLPTGTVHQAVAPGSHPEREWEVDAILSRLGIGDLADVATDRLSGGQAKRVALARALVEVGPGGGPTTTPSCSSSTSRPTTSTSTPSPGWRTASPATGAGASSSPTTATSSTGSRRESWSSTGAGRTCTRAATPPTWRPASSAMPRRPPPSPCARTWPRRSWPGCAAAPRRAPPSRRPTSVRPRRSSRGGRKPRPGAARCPCTSRRPDWVIRSSSCTGSATASGPTHRGCSEASTSSSTRASAWASSGPTAPGRPRCCR